MDYITGDIIKASINKIPFVYHYGIVLETDGIIQIVHNSPNEKNKYGGNILLSSPKEFFQTRKLIQVERTGIDKETIKSKVERFKTHSFNLISFNCEHFIFSIRDNSLHSPQLLNSIRVIATILMLAYSIKNRLLINKKLSWSAQ